MLVSDRQILEELAGRLRGVYPELRLWAFGSRARGDAERDSDFDVCAVLPELSDADRRRIRHVAWEVAFDHGTVFNTVILSAHDFEKGPMSESTLVANILREGVAA
jgi:predicted nucleotidyltransferase